jgi:hypothetical protein
MASREGGKTMGVSILHVTNAETKPGIEACTFGAILPQAKRAYKHVKSFIYERDPETGQKSVRKDIEGDPTKMETNWKNGSQLELLVGSKSGVNSPHPHVVHADEVDLMEAEVWEESRNMSSSGSGVDGRRLPALDIATSTRKSMKGLMQKILDEVDEAKRNGHRSIWAVYVFCFAEVAQEVPDCRCADPIERVHRLVALGKDPRSLCSCNEIVKGEWREDVPRTFESVCRGRLFKSRGWMSFEDIIAKFLQNSQATWEAQMECRRPMADGLYLPNFSRQRHCVRGWIPRPEYGRVIQGIDWGGAAASVVVWIQGPTLSPIEVPGFDGTPIVVPRGSYVIFDELEAPDMGATKLADLVCLREAEWKARFPGWRVRGRFADMAGRQQRNDWHEHSPPLRTHWYIPRDFDPTVEALQDLVGDDRLFVETTKCASLCDDFESWRRKNGKEVHDEATHGPAASRYAIGNAVVLERREGFQINASKALPVVKEREALDSGSLAAVASAPSTSNGGIETEQWRRSFGMLGSGRSSSDGWRNYGV